MHFPAVEGASWGQTRHRPPSPSTVQEPYSRTGCLCNGVGPRGLIIWVMWVFGVRTSSRSWKGRFMGLGCVSYLGLILLHSCQV